jgi:hypothetical protein
MPSSEKVNDSQSVCNVNFADDADSVHRSHYVLIVSWALAINIFQTASIRRLTATPIRC